MYNETYSGNVVTENVEVNVGFISVNTPEFSI
jgi:hypothetical protein